MDKRLTLTLQSNNGDGSCDGLSRAGFPRPANSGISATSLPGLDDRSALITIRVEEGAGEGRSANQQSRERSLIPKSHYTCDGWCDRDDSPYPTVLSLSACSDLQRRWGGPNYSLTAVVCDYLKTHRRPSYRALMSHINFYLHENALLKNTPSREMWATRSDDPFDMEPDSFQAPVLSSLAKLDMDEILKL